MAVRWDTINVDGQPMKIYLGLQDSPGPHPGVVVIHHGPGLDGQIQDVVHRLFRKGYVAAAPDLFHRQPAELPGNVARTSLLRDKEIIADVNATVVYLKGLRGTNADQIGITGFCMGGRVTYLMVANSSDFKAAAVFYGGNMMVALGEGPSPFELTSKVSCPLIGFFGEEDQNPSPVDVKKIDAELTKYDKPHEFHSYSGAGHAFQNFLDANRYRETAAKDSWAKFLAFFDQHLKAAGPFHRKGSV